MFTRRRSKRFTPTRITVPVVLLALLAVLLLLQQQRPKQTCDILVLPAAHALASASPPPLPTTLQSQVRRALHLSQRAANNTAFAREASDAWGELLHQQQLPNKIKQLAHIFRGHSLSQCGNDALAVQSYTYALSLDDTEEARMGCGKSMQRLMKYDEARDMFRQCEGGGEEAVSAAVTCSLRLGDVHWAKELLLNYCRVGVVPRGRRSRSSSSSSSNVGGGGAVNRTTRDDDVPREEITGLLGAILWLEHRMRLGSGGVNDDSLVPMEVVELLRGAASSSLPLYRWMYHLAVRERERERERGGDKKRTSTDSTNALLPSSNEAASETTGGRTTTTPPTPASSFLKLALINHGPFDPPQLVRLDNKLDLHRLLTGDNDGQAESSCSCWCYPLTFVLPDEMERFCHHCEEEEGQQKCWILKEPTGYGSHGNRIVTSTQVLEDTKFDDDDSPPVLCQRMVHPPLLLEGRKFSLRVYVLLLILTQEGGGGGKEDWQRQIYVCTEGLVKFAQLPYRDTGGAADEGTAAAPFGRNNKVQGDDAEAEAMMMMHMTNSALVGDGGDEKQCDLRYLQMEFDKHDGWDYVRLWRDVQSIIRTVMIGGNKKESKNNGGSNTWMDEKLGQVVPSHHLSQFALPKILGFDILLDNQRRPWLIEVNRFPGLEPRGESDAYVKNRVVEGAWRIASREAGVPLDTVGIIDNDSTLPQGSKADAASDDKALRELFEPLET